MRILIWLTFFLAMLSCFSCEKTVSPYDKDLEEILIRKIGHEISRYVGDSIQGLKPVKELEPQLYQIEFNGPFAFFSDSVINIIAREMRVNGQDNDYIVKVEECDSEEVIFSYFVSPKTEDSVIPCMGRDQVKNCYLVNIGFVPDSRFGFGWFLFILFGMLLIGLILYGLQEHIGLVKAIVDDDRDYRLTDMENVSLGKFGFNFAEQYLFIKEERIELTYKEAKLMKILTDNQGKVVPRENIQQEVWDDDGSMISRSLDMFISKLRKKLKRDPNVEIKSIHGIGYKLIVS